MGREDLRVIHELIKADESITTVIDIGCGTGEFLNSLPRSIAKFGIEPSTARHHAAALGITIVARDVAELPLSAKFHAATVIDVVEHITDVDQFLTSVYGHLYPGGKLIISTGDPTTLAWRILRSRFWYASFPEHITFPSSIFLRGWCDLRQAKVSKKLRIRYKKAGVGIRAIQLLVQLAFYCSPAIFNLVGRLASQISILPSNGRRMYSPGVAGLFADHQILVLVKPPA